LDHLKLRSPLNGAVLTTHMNEREGDFGPKGKLFCEVGSLDQVKIELPVRDYDLEEVKVGSRVLARMEAFPTKTFEGTVLNISPAIRERVEELSGAFTTFHAAVLIENPGKRLLPGMSGDAKILGERRSILARMAREIGRWIKFRIW
jgi:multidrug efflux pump subunit AcrA (membrane-fusion protein)